MTRLKIPVTVGSLVLMISGCNLVGPRAVRKARTSYNEAISRTGNEQLLLNLVRLKYRDTPFFLEVSSVSTQYTFGSQAAASLGKTGGSPGSAGLSAGFQFTERPTVVYTPLQGEKFVKQLLSPIAMDTLLLLYHSGWSLERVFRCCIQQLGLARNAPGASGPTPSYVPPYKEFIRAAQILRGFQVRDELSVGASADHGASKMVLRVAPAAASGAEMAELKRLLGITGKGAELHLTAAVGPGRKASEIGVVTRSLLGVMFYLSQSVEVPERDIQAGRVTVTKRANGQPFDWGEVTGNILRIRTSRGRPANAAVAVSYRGAWFYLADDDLDSKSTFSLLSQLFSLQSGNIKSITPVLTLPLGP